MTLAPNNLPESIALICKDLQLSPADFQLPKADDPQEQYRMFKQRLTFLIQRLIDEDFHRLLAALYRIDVSERKLKEAVHFTAPENVAGRIAELVIEREMKKVETRRKYRGYE